MSAEVYKEELRKHKGELSFDISPEKLDCVARLQEEYGITTAVVITSAKETTYVGGKTKKSINEIEVWYTPKGEYPWKETFYWINRFIDKKCKVDLAPGNLPVMRFEIDENRPHVKSADIVVAILADVMFQNAVVMERGEEPDMAFIFDMDGIKRGLHATKDLSVSKLWSNGMLSSILVRPCIMWAVTKLNSMIMKRSMKQWRAVADKTIYTFKGGKFYKGKF